MGKPLLPTLKEKKRYVAYEILADKTLTLKDVTKAIWESSLSYIGEKGIAEAGLQNVRYEDNKGVLKVSNSKIQDIKSSLLLMENIDNTPVVARSIGTSGILNKFRGGDK